MDSYRDNSEESQVNIAPKTSFFTRKLANKLGQQGVAVPQSVMMFLDTPLCTLNKEQSSYFESKFCPLIPNIVSALEDIFNEIGANPEGWEDMMTYAGNLDTPIKICANAVLVKKEKEVGDVVSQDMRAEQRTKKITLPAWLGQLS